MKKRENGIGKEREVLESVEALKNQIKLDQETLTDSPEYARVNERQEKIGRKPHDDHSCRLYSETPRGTRTIMDFLKERGIIPAETISLAEEGQTDDEEAQERAKSDIKCWDTQAEIVAGNIFGIGKTNDSDLEALFQEPTEGVRLFGEFYKPSKEGKPYFGKDFNTPFRKYLRDKINTDKVFSIGLKFYTEKSKNRTYYFPSLALVNDLGEKYVIKAEDSLGKTEAVLSLKTITKMIESVPDSRIIKKEVPENIKESNTWDRMKQVMGKQAA